MKINVSKFVALTACLALFCAIGQKPLAAADTPASGQLTQESLGNLLKALGLKPKTLETRYDFKFQANHEEAWVLSMSAVLSNDGETVWIMAWLDELPSSPREIPRVALLRLLHDNDKMGGGKFFSFIPGNRRFVLQRVVANRNMSTKKFRGLLTDLGKTVAETHGHWNVASWTDAPESSAPAAEQAAASTTDNKPAKATPASGTRTRTATKRPTTKK
jgi:hypothetical protein